MDIIHYPLWFIYSAFPKTMNNTLYKQRINKYKTKAQQTKQNKNKQTKNIYGISKQSKLSKNLVQNKFSNWSKNY